MKASSIIKEAYWFEGDLFVTFHSGQMYSYANVPESVYKDLDNAASVGKFFATNIKHKYEATLMTKIAELEFDVSDEMTADEEKEFLSILDESEDEAYDTAYRKWYNGEEMTEAEEQLILNDINNPDNIMGGATT